MKKKLFNLFLVAMAALEVYACFNPPTEAEATEAQTTEASETVTETLEVIPDGYINTNSEEFYNNYVNMNDVVDFEATDAGLMLHFSDGTGYWWEK